MPESCHAGASISAGGSWHASDLTVPRVPGAQQLPETQSKLSQDGPVGHLDFWEGKRPGSWGEASGKMGADDHEPWLQE
jgi:hypothetical protein